VVTTVFSINHPRVLTGHFLKKLQEETRTSIGEYFEMLKFLVSLKMLGFYVRSSPCFFSVYGDAEWFVC
jgi:hypothetical protein